MPASPSASASPCLLVVDTATEVVHLALVTQGQVRVRAVAGGAQASAATLPQMQALLAEAGLAWSQLDAIGFGQGPGAFTGLRTACAITQGLALALDRPVLALDTLMAVAESARRRQPALAQAAADEPALWVLQDARMQEVYAAPYRHTPQGGWRAEASAELWPIAHAR
ncbi:MAG: tRNA (adenosine(37)-N6)-threonylcarbamoyltransferase complex dimerization subunit type 1 TsaB, partial [Rubrivivax sp.]